MTRFDTDMGNDGQDDPPGDLLPLATRYRFDGRTWSITIWARSFDDAQRQCNALGMTLDGQIIGIYDA